MQFFPIFSTFFQPSRILSNPTDLGDCTIVNDNERRWFPANSLLVYMPSASLTAEQNSTVLNNSRSGFLFTSEESFTSVSLMAGDVSLGPSDAPCRVETSTAHGELFFSVTVFSALWISALAIYHVQSLAGPNLSSPEMHNTTQISPSSSMASHRASFFPWSTKAKLGFSLVGLESETGPLTFSKPMSNILKTRSDLIFYLSNFSQYLVSIYALNGRGLHLRLKSTRLLWFYNDLMRTLVFAPIVAFIDIPKTLKNHGLLVPNPNCQRSDSGHGRSLATIHSTTTISSDFKHHPNVNTSKTWILFYKEDLDDHKEDPEPLCVILDQASTDYTTIITRFMAFALLCVALLVPARIMAMIPSLTSFCLLTMTTLSTIDVFMDDLSTYHDLTCAKSFSNICLKALMNSMSISFSYLFVALGNVSLYYVLNFGIFESFSLYLGFI